MAVLTNHGKRVLTSYAYRFEHPNGSGAPSGTAYAANVFRAELSTNGTSGLPCYWGHFLRQTYFLDGINPDHGTLGEIEAEVAGSVVGYTVHNTATRWFTGNFIAMSGAAWPAPVAEDDNDDSSTMAIPPMLITTQTGPNYAGFTGNDRIGGWAMCLSNAAAAATEVVAIFEFSNGLLAPASAAQAISVINQSLTLAES